MGGTLRSQSLAVSNRLGVSRFVGQSSWRRRRLLILCYHGISLENEHQWNPALYMSAERLESRLAALQRCGCTVLPLGDAIARLYRGELPARAVALTFDDGYFDFMERAWPLLERFGYPVTVYLPTLRCEHNLPIMNVLVSYMLWMRHDRILKAPDLPGLGDDPHPLATADQRADVLRRINKVIVPLDPPPETRDEIARAIARHLHLDYDQFASRRLLTVMKPAEVASLAIRGVDFQLHTHRHRTPADDREFVEEILENRQRIEAMTGRPAIHFCYPSGVHKPSYLPLLRAHGVLSATTTKNGIADCGTDPLLLPRFVDTSNVSGAEFEAWLHGVMPWLQGSRAN